MQSLKTLALIALLTAWALAGGSALAHDGHGGYGGHFHGGGHRGHSGVFLGAPTFVWPMYPFPDYYSPPVVVVPPPVYIERGQPAGYSYYCTDPQGYYPDVQVCPGGWQPVPAPPPQ